MCGVANSVRSRLDLGSTVLVPYYRSATKIIGFFLYTVHMGPRFFVWCVGLCYIYLYTDCYSLHVCQVDSNREYRSGVVCV